MANRRLLPPPSTTWPSRPILRGFCSADSSFKEEVSTSLLNFISSIQENASFLSQNGNKPDWIRSGHNRPWLSNRVSTGTHHLDHVRERIHFQSERRKTWPSFRQRLRRTPPVDKLFNRNNRFLGHLRHPTRHSLVDNTKIVPYSLHSVFLQQ